MSYRTDSTKTPSHEHLFGSFAQERRDLDVFIETKSNLQKSQIRTLAVGGVKCMQPGLESLSLTQLKAMDKGVTPMQNLVCLKWCFYYRVAVSWNILLGFPGETNDDYRRQIALLPSLFHLQPPEGAGKFWLERFSPYYTRPHEYGIRIAGPGMAYSHVYDSRQVDLAKIAYDFEYELDQWSVDPEVFQELMSVVEEWQRRAASADKPFLYYSKAFDYVTVYDGRTMTPTRERFDWPASLFIDLCSEAPKSLEHLRSAVRERGDVGSAADGVIQESLERLTAKRILYEERGKYFTLANPEHPYY